MSLENILLGLCRSPQSGYDLKQVFDVAIRYFWPAELSQIYTALQRMERRGLLRSQFVVSKKGPKRREYQTTAIGRARLRQWLRQGPAFGDERYVFSAQIFFLDALNSVHESEVFVQRLRTELRARREALALIEYNEAEAGEYPAEDFHRFLSLRMGIRVLEARIAWCDEALAALRLRKKKEKADGRPV